MTRTMLVASAGGHLDELLIIVEQLGIDVDDAVWVTGRVPQTESLLRDREVAWVPRVGSGEKRKAVTSLPGALRLHRRIRPELVVSTGALFSTPHLLAASLHRCETWFIDSATRIKGPSSTGQFAQRFTKAKLFVQGPGWGDPAWTPIGGVFDAFEAVPRSVAPENGFRRAVVSLGTEHWPFNRALDPLLEILAEDEVIWQAGAGAGRGTHRGQPLRDFIPADELYRAFDEADVVVTHAGVGSVLSALKHGKVPVVLPRLSAYRETTDDHQLEFAELMDERGLAVHVEPSALTRADLVRAAALEARRVAP